MTEAPLYSVPVLRLAAEGALLSPLSPCDAEAEANARLCGSRVRVTLCLDASGRVVGYGHSLSACALGQASAALLARHIVGMDASDVARARADLAAWLTASGGDASDNSDKTPLLAGFEALGPARAYPARHPAILLPFDAVLAALEKRGL